LIDSSKQNKESDCSIGDRFLLLLTKGWVEAWQCEPDCCKESGKIIYEFILLWIWLYSIGNL